MNPIRFFLTGLISDKQHSVTNLTGDYAFIHLDEIYHLCRHKHIATHAGITFYTNYGQTVAVMQYPFLLGEYLFVYIRGNLFPLRIQLR